jgi:hypothetical protein
MREMFQVVFFYEMVFFLREQPSPLDPDIEMSPMLPVVRCRRCTP